MNGSQQAWSQTSVADNLPRSHSKCSLIASDRWHSPASKHAARADAQLLNASGRHILEVVVRGEFEARRHGHEAMPTPEVDGYFLFCRRGGSMIVAPRSKSP